MVDEYNVYRKTKQKEELPKEFQLFDATSKYFFFTIFLFDIKNYNICLLNVVYIIEKLNMVSFAMWVTRVRP